MSYFADSTASGPGPYSAARPAVARQGMISSYEDPPMACGFQSNYHLQRACYPFWEEMATQEVPTGLEHCGSVPPSIKTNVSAGYPFQEETGRVLHLFTGYI
uniref:ETS proto-oncogene 1, transcription factor n=1 Tax=Molossus molossus TaxID=27622 RepID=A0A7J8BXT2_MOLMO|nr:ETS proto-oncogene 1, transcription factor [Molossus molossus]